jgi:hypothetical protein
MAIRTAVFQSGVRFDASIGPRNSSYAMGSETELVLRGRPGTQGLICPKRCCGAFHSRLSDAQVLGIEACD